MFEKRHIFFVGLILISCIYLFGCSSSSQSQRYNKEEEAKSKQKSARFTSADDDETIRDSKNSNSKTYNNYLSAQDEFDEYPLEEDPVDKSEYIANVRKENNFASTFSPKEKLLAEVITLLDTPYKYGGVTDKGIDCSAFTQTVMSKSVSLKLPRTASQQYKVGEKIYTEKKLKFGDLVFFNTTKRAYPGHVGIYLGENLFAHASRSKGVIVSSLENNYYQKRFVGGRRIKDFSK